MTSAMTAQMSAPKSADAIDPEEAWRAVVTRDRACDGRFVTGVLSTGIYCRPSCAARHPARANVRFFANGAAARAAGLRACRRCRPDDLARDEQAVLAAIATIKSAEQPVPLAELAEAQGYSAAHFQRLFQRHTGLSPAAYARALRAAAAADALTAESSVTDAVYAAGYSGPSRFYAEADGRLGMAPSAWVRGGEGVTIRWAIVPTSLGSILVAATEKGVCRLAFGESAADLARRFPRASLAEGGNDFVGLVRDVASLVEEPGKGGAIPLDVRGTAFQERIWQALRAIPPGETRSYAELAAAAGHPAAVRAAGSANGANPVAVLIPCHRVVRSDGALGGYAWGEDRKRELLERERGKGRG